MVASAMVMTSLLKGKIEMVEKNKPAGLPPELEQQLMEHTQAFLGFVRKRVSDPELAKDIVQESFLKAVKSLNQLHDEEQVVPWFYQILRRTIIDGYRRRATSEAFLERLEKEMGESNAGEEQKEFCQCFRPLLSTMKPEYALVIEKLDLQTRPVEEVAREFQVTPKNLQMRLYRARQKLKERLVQCCGRCAEHGCLDCDCKKP